MKSVMLALALAALVATVHGHGAMVHPRSRNSIDWAEVPDNPSKGIHNTGARICSNLTGAQCNNGQVNACSCGSTIQNILYTVTALLTVSVMCVAVAVLVQSRLLHRLRRVRSQIWPSPDRLVRQEIRGTAPRCVLSVLQPIHDHLFGATPHLCTP